MVTLGVAVYSMVLFPIEETWIHLLVSPVSGGSLQHLPRADGIDNHLPIGMTHGFCQVYPVVSEHTLVDCIPGGILKVANDGDIGVVHLHRAIVLLRMADRERRAIPAFQALLNLRGRQQ